MASDDEEVVFEASLSYKEGLRDSRFETHFATLKRESLTVYLDSSKEQVIQTFHTSSSWVSASSYSESGLFVLNVSSSSSCKLYMFETGSDLVLRTWLRAFNTAGWKSAIVGNQLNYSYVPPPMSPDQRSSGRVRQSGRHEKFTRKKSGKLLKQRSKSLPLLIPAPADIVPFFDEGCDVASVQASEEQQHFHPVSGSSSARQSIAAESGYCSKESLLVDSDKSGPRHQIQEQRYSSGSQVAAESRRRAESEQLVSGYPFFFLRSTSI